MQWKLFTLIRMNTQGRQNNEVLAAQFSNGRIVKMWWNYAELSWIDDDLSLKHPWKYGVSSRPRGTLQQEDC